MSLERLKANDRKFYQSNHKHDFKWLANIYVCACGETLNKKEYEEYKLIK